MADEQKFYAWSPIKYHDGESLKTIKVGSEVSRSSLKTTEEHWAELLEGGAVRPTPYPKGLDPSNPNAPAPNTHLLMKLRKERERLEAEMAGVGGSAHVLSNPEESPTEAEADTINDQDYELDEKGELRLDADGNPIRKAPVQV